MTATYKLLLILLLISGAAHFAFFGHPNETVFDEVHFGKFVSGYYTHQYYFDIHPPLGKLMIAGFAKLFDFKPEFSFAEIGQKFPDKMYMILRFLPSLAGTLFPLIIFLLALELGFSRVAAFAAGILVALDNALLVQSRSILLDLFLLDFGFLSLLFYFKYRHISTLYFLPSTFYLLLMSLFGAFAASIKWTGLSFLAVAFIIEAFTIIRNRQISTKKIANIVLFFAVIPFIIYYSIFAIHFKLLNRSGPGDAFMTPEFRKTLISSSEYQNPEIKPLNTFQKFTELNIEMYESNQRLTAPHPYGSNWISWPFMVRPIYYWTGESTMAGTERIYLLGNPVVWWGSTVAVFMLIGLVISRQLKSYYVPAVFASGYLLNLLPFIGVKRVMFLYHYFVPLVFAILLLAWLLDHESTSERRKKITAFALIAVSAISFLYFSPISYGLKISDNAYNNRVWLKTWK